MKIKLTTTKSILIISLIINIFLTIIVFSNADSIGSKHYSSNIEIHGTYNLIDKKQLISVVFDNEKNILFL